MSPQASVCLNIAEDHVDLFGTFEDYVAAKARIYERTQVAAVYNVADPVTRRMVEEADVVEGCRAIGFTLGVPDLSMLGVVEDILVDRAFVPNRAEAAQELGVVADVHPAAPHNVANALAAAALARAHGVPAAAVRDGLRAFAARRAPDRRRRHRRRRALRATTPRRPTATPRRPRCWPTTGWCGSPAAWPRASSSTSWCKRPPSTWWASCCWAWTGG